PGPSRGPPPAARRWTGHKERPGADRSTYIDRCAADIGAISSGVAAGTASTRTEPTCHGGERETWCMGMSAPTMHDARDERRLTLALFAVAWGANQFTPLLLVSRPRSGFRPAVLGALWGCYAVGLVRGLLLGGAASDARGRRPVVIPFFFLSLLATGVLVAGALWSPALALGRLLAGVVSGVVFGAGSA